MAHAPSSLPLPDALVCSRLARDLSGARALLARGQVRVNGELPRQLEACVHPEDHLVVRKPLVEGEGFLGLEDLRGRLADTLDAHLEGPLLARGLARLSLLRLEDLLRLEASPLAPVDVPLGLPFLALVHQVDLLLFNADHDLRAPWDSARAQLLLELLALPGAARAPGRPNAVIIGKVLLEVRGDDVLVTCSVPRDAGALRPLLSTLAPPPVS